MSRIVSVSTVLVQLPTRREHKWTGLTEPIGRYILTKMTDDDGRIGWGEAARAQGLGGEFGAISASRRPLSRLVVERYLAPAVKGSIPRTSSSSRTHGRRHQGLSVCEGRGRIRRVRPRAAAPRRPVIRCSAAACQACARTLRSASFRSRTRRRKPRRSPGRLFALIKVKIGAMQARSRSRAALSRPRQAPTWTSAWTRTKVQRRPRCGRHLRAWNSTASSTPSSRAWASSASRKSRARSTRP